MLSNLKIKKMDAKLSVNELRIGNWVQRFGKILQIDSIRKDNTYYLGGDYVGNGVCYDTIDAFEPLELTEQWLKDFGFKHVNTLTDGTKTFAGEPYLYFKVRSRVIAPPPKGK